MTNETVTNKQLRSFGFTVGGIFVLIGLWPLVVHGEGPRWWAAVVGGCLLVQALVFPASLFWIRKVWMACGDVLGWINTRIILGVVFYAVVTPIGMLRNLLGQDPMSQRLRPELDSYRVACQPRPATHLTKQY